MSSATNVTRGGCIVLLDVPPSSSITLDGITRVTPSSSQASTQPPGFHQGLCIVDNVTSDSQFHLLVVRSGGQERNQNGGSLPVGFVLLSNSANSINSYGYDWILARRYERQTEEISNEPLDELTMRNLMMAMTEQNGELSKFVMSYDQFMGSKDGKSIASWKSRTSFIGKSFLHHQHGLSHGEKIVPSSEASCDPKSTDSRMNKIIDGKPISYPTVPCIDPTISARQLMSHKGTKAYISGLSPNLRTWLLFGGECTFGFDTKPNLSPEGYVWNNILSSHYSGDGCNRKEDYLLADIQLSFIVFLFLECHSSLDHWRDALSMSSLTFKSSTKVDKDCEGLIQKPTFIIELLSTLYAQLSCIEADFFEEAEYSSGENNFLIGAMRRFFTTCDVLDDCTETARTIKSISLKLQKLASSRFHLQLSPSPIQDVADCDIDMTNDAYATECGRDATWEEPLDEDKPEDDGPVIVPTEEVEASMSRSSLENLQTQKYSTGQDKNHEHRLSYPLLFAAMAPHEDIVMTCARILDAGNDVSLVREAAAFLEDVEAHRR